MLVGKPVIQRNIENSAITKAVSKVYSERHRRLIQNLTRSSVKDFEKVLVSSRVGESGSCKGMRFDTYKFKIIVSLEYNHCDVSVVEVKHGGKEKETITILSQKTCSY